VMAAGLVQLEGQGEHPRSGEGPLSYATRPRKANRRTQPIRAT
jgi:hypothetical protein